MKHKHKWQFVVIIDNPCYYDKKKLNKAKFICECGKVKYVKIIK